MPCWLVCPCSWCVLVVGVLGGGYLHSLVVRALVVGVSLWLVCLVVVTCMPWSLCFDGWCVLVYLGGSCLAGWLVVGRFVVGGYLYAF